MDAGGRAMQEQLPRRKNQLFILPLIPAFSLKGEGAGTCVDNYAKRV
jgi:hypothetical protein